MEGDNFFKNKKLESTLYLPTLNEYLKKKQLMTNKQKLVHLEGWSYGVLPFPMPQRNVALSRQNTLKSICPFTVVLALLIGIQQLKYLSPCQGYLLSNSAQSWSMTEVLCCWRQCHGSRHRGAEVWYEGPPQKMWQAQLTVWLPNIVAVLTALHTSWCCPIASDKKILSLMLSHSSGANPFKL